MSIDLKDRGITSVLLHPVGTPLPSETMPHLA